MGSFIAQQPNGLYCRFSTIVDTVTHYNMTKDDYIEDKQADFHFEPVTLKMFAHAYKLHCEECEKKKGE